MRKKIVILGAGGHAKVIAEFIDKEKYDLIGFLDKDESCLGKLINGIPILGDDSNPMKWKEKGVSGCVIGLGHVGNCKVRNKVYHNYLQAGYEMLTVVHPNSIVSPSAILHAGVVVMPGAIINANAEIGENSIINTNSVVEHDSIIESGVHIAPGSTISGGSYVGSNVLIGAGSTVIQSIRIGEETIIGAGATVINDIPANVLAVGCPAKVIRKGK